MLSWSHISGYFFIKTYYMKNHRDNLRFLRILPPSKKEFCLLLVGGQLLTLGILDHLNLVRDKDVSKLSPESAKTGLFYVFFTPRDMTIWGHNIKPGCYQYPHPLPYPHTLLGPYFQYLIPPQPCRSVESSTIFNRLYGTGKAPWEKGPQMHASPLRISLLSQILASILFITLLAL